MVAKDTSFSLTFVIVSIVVIVILSVLLYMCKKNGGDTFCACRNMTDKRCPNPFVLTDLYNSNKLTEFSNFAEAQKLHPYWKMVMPNDIFEAEMREKK